MARAVSVAERRWTIGRTGVALFTLLSSIAIVSAIAVGCGIVYHRIAHSEWGNIQGFASIGALLGVLYAEPWSRLAETDVHTIAQQRASVREILWRWAKAFMWFGLAAFLLKFTNDLSRGWVLVLFGVGYPALIASERANQALVRAAISAGRVDARRVLLVGPLARERLAHLSDQIVAGSAVRIIGAIETPSEGGDLPVQLAHVIATARTTGATDIVLLCDWSENAFIDAASTAFSILPATLRIELVGHPSRFAGIKADVLGPLRTVVVANPPLGHVDTTVKRTFDVTVALLALVALMPVFAVIAMMIKLDSTGPVFFRQRRVGYNQREFRIWKFRSMTTLDDGDRIVQAKRGDARITKVGAWLRRYNIDELPQLINVLNGEMSLVGPRPHAVAHDKAFGARIVDYPRRLNVKPGITGWAQIKGFRGETDTDEKMLGRVEHDLYYVDNWSLALDIWIIAMTVASAKTYQNAY
jgi:Undecaprenyl-phosphate glucose phosphotransferase